MENHALLTPIDYSALVRLKYDDFREQSRQRVEELSDGRLGYLHIQAMNQASLEEFQGDLYAAALGKEGLIIDVRNNGGGHTTDRILTSIDRKSTRLNSSHVAISYAVFCLKKKIQYITCK